MTMDKQVTMKKQVKAAVAEVAQAYTVEHDGGARAEGWPHLKVAYWVKRHREWTVVALAQLTKDEINYLRTRAVAARKADVADELARLSQKIFGD
jgi:hypothetical protein